MRCLLIFLTCFLAWMEPGVLHAWPQAIHFEHLTVEDGLAHNYVQAIVQDRQGFMWFGTHDGLNRYDGYEFRVYRYDSDDSTSLSNNYVWALYEDRQGVLWIGTWGGGLSRFDRQTEQFTRYVHDANDPASLSNNTVWALHEDSQGMLWVGTQSGLNRFDRQTGIFTHYRHNPADATSLSNDWISALFEDSEGMLWVGTWGRGLNRFDRQTGRFTRYLHDASDLTSLSHDWVQVLYEDRRGVFWVGTQSGLNRFDRQTGRFTRYLHDVNDPTSLNDNSVWALYEAPTQPEVLWVGTESGGLNRFDRQTGRFTRYIHDANDPASLSNNRVHAIYEDQQGILWVGVWGGLNRFDWQTGRLTLFRPDPDDPTSLSGNTVWALHEDSQGMLWVGTQSGLNRFDRQTGIFTHYRHNPADATSLSNDWVSALFEDSEGMLWVGTWGGGLNRFDRQTGIFTHYRHNLADTTSLSNNWIMTVYEDRRGVFWVGTQSGLNRFDRQTERFSVYQHDPVDSTSLSSDWVMTIYEDLQEMLWVGTQSGLNRFDRQTGIFTPYRHNPADVTSLSNDWVSFLHEDSQGMLWVGTQSGLNRFDRQTDGFRRFTEHNSGLSSDAVPGILEDEQGKLWLSTSRGLARFDPGTETFRIYGSARGALSQGYTIGSFYRSRRSELFFGGIGGFNAFFPEHITDNPYLPRVVLTDFRLFNESVRPGEDGPLRRSITVANEVRLAHDENFIELDFAGLHYSNPAGNRHAYMLEGFDPDWYEIGSQHTATYTNLDLGVYTFRVRAASAYGVWSEEEATLRVVVLPPWWRTWWAYALYAMVLMAVVYAVDRVRRVHLEDRLKAEAADERAQVLQELDQMKSRFFLNVSHEFRTPLTLILGPLYDFLDGAFGDLDERQREQLTIMQRNGARLLRLINQLLDVSRLEAGRLELRARRADLIPFLKRLVAAFTSYAERKHIALQFDSHLDAAEVYFEADKLEKVVVNLLSNAFKFTSSGGKIRVAVEESNDEQDAFFEVIIKDTGKGIPAKELPYIFDRFHQVDSSTTRAHEGTGIGLALAKELVVLHGGEIRAESEPGFGSTFSVRLRQGTKHLDPVAIVEEIPEAGLAEVGRPVASSLMLEKVALHKAETNGTMERVPSEEAPLVLIVEDNADMRAYLKSHLSEYYRVAEAEDGQAGLRLARKTPPDLVLTDVMMPKVDGYELCRALKANAQLNHIPVILLTAKADEVSKLEGLKLGADDYLYKPFSMAGLLARVENLIEIRRLLRQRFSHEVVVEPGEITVPSAEEAFLERVHEVVEQHLGDSNFGVDWLADEVGLSVRQLRRRLKTATRLSPGGYIRMMRLKRAAQLLKRQVGTVAEVTYAVGFRDTKHFSKLFHQVYGVHPSEYGIEEN